MFDYIDVHSHVNFVAFDADRDETVKRALDSGVFMVNVGTQIDTSKKAIEMAEKYDKGVYATIGLHPVHTDKSFHDEKELGEGGKEFTSRGEVFDENAYRSMAKQPKVVGIGECGLDYYRLEPESERKQREVFVSHIALANEVRKPLMLHVRNGSDKSAYRDALVILKSEAKVKGDFHFFAGGWDEAKEILDAGFNLSFTGVITFARNYDEVVKNVPLNRIMSETDCPYVTPSPFRGKRNEPMHVREVVKKIAEIRGENFEIVRRQLVQNAKDFFSLSSE
ncbi:MAG: TatD family deoxyribonuclease [Candidatus Taylorbacteria bacterium]|nr:TatD family deoxyribonuclease [Candidatus Taylorbacteria bacterium]